MYDVSTHSLRDSLSLHTDRFDQILTEVCASAPADEVWRQAVDREGAPYTSFIVSNYGRVLRIPGLSRGYTKKPHPGTLLTPINGIAGHQYIGMCLIETGKVKRVLAHQLVAWTFIGPQPTDQGRVHVRHLDGNPKNNHVSNLKYGSPWENVQDRNRNYDYNTIGLPIGSAIEARIRVAATNHPDIEILQELVTMIEKVHDRLNE